MICWPSLWLFLFSFSFSRFYFFVILKDHHTDLGEQTYTCQSEPFVLGVLSAGLVRMNE
jgi:hypothetical protein